MSLKKTPSHVWWLDTTIIRKYVFLARRFPVWGILGDFMYHCQMSFIRVRGNYSVWKWMRDAKIRLADSSVVKQLLPLCLIGEEKKTHNRRWILTENTFKISRFFLFLFFVGVSTARMKSRMIDFHRLLFFSPLIYKANVLFNRCTELTRLFCQLHIRKIYMYWTWKSYKGRGGGLV